MADEEGRAPESGQPQPPSPLPYVPPPPPTASGPVQWQPPGPSGASGYYGPPPAYGGNPWQPPPGPGYPTYSQQPYWAGRQQPGSSVLAIGAGVALLVVGALVTLLGLLVLLVGSLGTEALIDIDPSFALGGSGVAPFLVASGVIVLALGVLDLISSIGVFLHKSWARWTGVVIGVLGAVLGLLVVLAAAEPPFDGGMMIVGLVWAGAHAFAVLGLALGGRHFAPDRPY